MTKTNHINIGGTTKMGKRGQVVIPADIRREMKLKKGDHLLVFYRKGHLIGLVKSDQLDKMLSKMTGRLTKLKKLKKDITR